MEFQKSEMDLIWILVVLPFYRGKKILLTLKHPNDYKAYYIHTNLLFWMLSISICMCVFVYQCVCVTICLFKRACVWVCTNLSLSRSRSCHEWYFISLINICSEKRNTTNDGNGTCTHVINAFYTFNMTFSNKIS